MKHDLAVDRLSMTYSWHDINTKYKNNVIKYSIDSGNSWETLNFVDGMYSYSDINDYLHQYMYQTNHDTGHYDKCNINIIFVLSSYNVIIEINDGFQLDI